MKKYGYYTFNRLILSPVATFVSVFLGTIVIFMLFIFVLYHNLSRVGYLDLDECLSTGITHAYYMEYDSVSKASLGEIEQEILQLDEVVGLGSYLNYGENAYPNIGDNVYWIEMRDCTYPVCSLSEHVCKGIKPEDLTEEEFYRALYLGYQYRDIPLHTVTYFAGKEYEVMGILDSSARLYDQEGLLQNSFATSWSYTISLENAAICFISYSPTDSLLLAIDDNCSNEEFMNHMSRILESYGVIATRILTPLSGTLNVKANNNSIANERLFPLLVFGVIACCMIFLSLQLLQILSNEKEFGIWLSNGMSKWDITWILLFENAVKITISLIFSLCGWVIFMKLCYLGANTSRLIRLIMVQGGFAELLGVLILIVLLSTAIPMLVIWRKSTVKLIRGRL